MIRTEISKTYPGELDDNSQALLKTVTEKNPYIEKKGTEYWLKDDCNKDDAINWKYSNHIDINHQEYLDVNVKYYEGEEEKVAKNVGTGKDLYWHDPNNLGYIYSIHHFIEMINHAFDKLLNDYKIDFTEGDYKDEDNYHTDLITKLYPNSNIHFAYNNGRLELRINPHLAEAICNDKFYKAPFEEDDHENEGKKRMNNGFRKMRIFISDNLFRYLKYLHFEGSWDYENYFVLSLSTTDYNNALTKEINGREYKVYEGDEVNIMEWCDYIGIAVTSPDFPIKQQIYPHFMYDFDNPTAQNRRRYVNSTEDNIKGFKNVFADESSITKDMFGGERVNEQIKTSIPKSILFIKYFGKGDDINNINYENSDSNTSLKMDIENMTPLQKFTLRLYWIDRYNNFIPLVPFIEEYDDIIKMQLHFQCIKGSEKENRYIIEPVSQEPTTITGIYDKSEKERVVIQTDPETGQEMVEVYEIPPNNKRNKVIEEEMEFNPINELY